MKKYFYLLFFISLGIASCTHKAELPQNLKLNPNSEFNYLLGKSDSLKINGKLKFNSKSEFALSNDLKLKAPKNTELLFNIVAELDSSFVSEDNIILNPVFEKLDLIFTKEITVVWKNSVSVKVKKLSLSDDQGEIDILYRAQVFKSIGNSLLSLLLNGDKVNQKTKIDPSAFNLKIDQFMLSLRELDPISIDEINIVPQKDSKIEVNDFEYIDSNNVRANLLLDLKMTSGSNFLSKDQRINIEKGVLLLNCSYERNKSHEKIVSKELQNLEIDRSYFYLEKENTLLQGNIERFGIELKSFSLITELSTGDSKTLIDAAVDLSVLLNKENKVPVSDNLMNFEKGSLVGKFNYRLSNNSSEIENNGDIIIETQNAKIHDKSSLDLDLNKCLFVIDSLTISDEDSVSSHSVRAGINLDVNRMKYESEQNLLVTGPFEFSDVKLSIKRSGEATVSSEREISLPISFLKFNSGKHESLIIEDLNVSIGVFKVNNLNQMRLSSTVFKPRVLKIKTSPKEQIVLNENVEVKIKSANYENLNDLISIENFEFDIIADNPQLRYIKHGVENISIDKFSFELKGERVAKILSFNGTCSLKASSLINEISVSTINGQIDLEINKMLFTYDRGKMNVEIPSLIIRLPKKIVFNDLKSKVPSSIPADKPVKVTGSDLNNVINIFSLGTVRGTFLDYNIYNIQLDNLDLSNNRLKFNLKSKARLDVDTEMKSVKTDNCYKREKWTNIKIWYPCVKTYWKKRQVVSTTVPFEIQGDIKLNFPSNNTLGDFRVNYIARATGVNLAGFPVWSKHHSIYLPNMKKNFSKKGEVIVTKSTPGVKKVPLNRFKIKSMVLTSNANDVIISFSAFYN